MKKEEIKTRIRRAKYKISRNLLTVDNVIIVVSVIVALAWIWGSISSMERNYSLQRQLELKTREKLIAEIQYKTLEFENQYLQSEEYQELAARENLGLVAQGESMLILADYPAEEAEKITTETGEKDSNFTQWMNFIFGGNAQKSSKS